jgi:hypothetical protein
MVGNVPEDDVVAGVVKAVVLGEQVRVGVHVVVEEHDDLTGRLAHPAVAGSRGAGVRLLDDHQREPRPKPSHRRRRAVVGAVDDDDHLERRRALLAPERLDTGDDELPAPIRRDDDAEPEGVRMLGRRLSPSRARSLTARRTRTGLPCNPPSR